jgi:hypothetical protein
LKRSECEGTVRTCEQGADYLIELEGDTLSVYGSPAIHFLERPWNRAVLPTPSKKIFGKINLKIQLQSILSFKG